MKTRAEGLALLLEHTKSQSLIKHSLAVESAMEWYANYFQLLPAEVEEWRLCGLLHDFDYELHPDPTPPDGHPFFGNRLLLSLGYSEAICEAIMGHADYSGVKRVTKMAKTLYAVDELSGLITAAVLVRPDRSIHPLECRSIIKKMKDKAFARGCNRDDIRRGAEELGISLDEHITNVITAMKGRSAELELNGLQVAV